MIEGNRDGTVQAMYWVKRVGGGTSASEILHINIGAQAIPTLDNVKDANGGEIPENTDTVTASVSVNGTASKGRNVEIYDGGGASAVLKCTETADPVTGIWSLANIAVAVGGHRFYAKALYYTGGTPYSNVRLFTVTPVVTPTITSVKDPQDSEIANGGTTTATTVTLRGKASNNQQVEIFDGSTSKGTAPVNANGDWSKQVTGLSVATHSFTAKGLYGSNPVSTARTLTVIAVVTPTITSVKDPQETEIANGGTTIATTVTLRGKASNNQQVEIFDGTTSKGTAPVNANGDWSKQVTGLSMTTHSFTAKGLYGNNPVSTARTLTVVAVVTPTITSVRDPQETEIANGGTTTATTVTLRGKASNNQQVEIFDGTTSKGTAPVNANGDWSKQVTGLSVTAHSFTAKALYGGGETSAPYTFTVNPAIPDLVIDPSPVNLSAVHHRSHVTPTHPPAGAYVDRVASGGVPPYGYSSSNPDVAEVNASTGRVISKGSGSATITARDQSGKTASYTVHCANIRWYFGYTRGNYFNSNAWVQGQGGTLPTEAEHAALRTNYGGNGLTAGIGNSDISRNWIPDPGGAPLGQKYVIDPRDGRKFTIMDFGGPSGASANADGYGVKNK
ncbi:hypothetical protein ASC85_29675 [Pseudomonas sp. Root401]|nr:hypothetical protein ASC85_29675 [Pseudomonas sp. Root401]